MGTLRTTFIIDEDGIVTNIIGPKEVKTKDHAIVYVVGVNISKTGNYTI